MRGLSPAAHHGYGAPPLVVIRGHSGSVPFPARDVERRVALVLGKPPRAGLLPAGVRDALVVAGSSVQVVLPHEDGTAATDVRAAVRAADLVLHRGLSPAALDRLAAEMEDAAVAGVAPVCIDPPAAVARLADRWAVLRTLEDAGVPVPPSVLVEDGDDPLLAGVLRDRPVVVKSRWSRTGRGREVAVLWGRGDGAVPSPAGPALVQRVLEDDGRDRKVYVVGDSCRMVTQPSLTVGGGRSSRVAPGTRGPAPDARHEEPVPREVEDVARRAAGAAQLQLCGVDVLVTPDGPVVVDVNAFPAMRGVADAVGLVSDHVVTALGAHRRDRGGQR